MAEYLNVASVEPDQHGTTREWPRVGFVVVITRHADVVGIPGIVGKMLIAGGNVFDFVKYVVEVLELFLVLFGDTNIPHVVMTEIDDNGVGPCCYHRTQGAIAQQRAFKKPGRGFMHDKGMAFGTCIGIDGIDGLRERPSHAQQEDQYQQAVCIFHPHKGSRPWVLLFLQRLSKLAQNRYALPFIRF